MNNKVAKVLIITLSIFASIFPQASYPSEDVGWFKISKVFVSNASNMHFRVFGPINMPYCPESINWAYLDEDDSGAKGKISALLSAYTTGKEVFIRVVPVSYYNNSKLFCRIIELSVRN